MCQICGITGGYRFFLCHFDRSCGLLCRVSEGGERSECNLLSDNKRASVIYRMGQKRLVRGFLQEAEMALEVCLDYVSSD